MKSPVTGKEMILQREKRTLDFRKESFAIVYHFYRCEDSGEEFVDTKLGDLNLRQVHNLYRARHHLPFPEEIRQIREQYGLSATKMSEILGFGVNSYGNYERGEVPALSNAKMIQMAAPPRQFKELVELSDSLSENERQKLLKKLDQLVAEERANWEEKVMEEYLLRPGTADLYSGFRKPALGRITQMVLFFAGRLQPWKTQLNKLLFYTDFLMFKENGMSISGLRYRAIQNGPVPCNYDSLFEYLVNRRRIAISKIAFSPFQVGEQFQPATGLEHDIFIFSQEEQLVMERVASHFEGLNATQISELSHREEGWIENHERHELIPYSYAFRLKEL